MFKEVVFLGLGLCCLFAYNHADAYEFDKKGIMKAYNCKSGDTLQYAYKDLYITKEDRFFENDTVKIEVLLNLGFDNLLTSSATRKHLANNTIILPIGGNPMMGFNTFVLIAPAVTFRITNKTEQPIEFDLDHSQITVGTYQGRGVQQGTKYNGAATSVQAPVMLFPKSTKDVTLWRTDHNFVEGFYYNGQALIPSKWMPPFDVMTDRNLLGDMILCLDKKYITMKPKAVIPSSTLKWVKN